MSRPKTINKAAKFQSIRGTAEITGLSAAYLKKGCIAGTIPHIKVGTDYRIDIDAFLGQLQKAAQKSISQE